MNVGSEENERRRGETRDSLARSGFVYSEFSSEEVSHVFSFFSPSLCVGKTHPFIYFKNI